MPDDADFLYIEHIECRENPFSEDDVLCQACCDQLTPWEHQKFLGRLVEHPAGEWVRLVDVCSEARALPDVYPRTRSRLANKVVVARLEWPGARIDATQPTYLVLFTNVESMWTHQALFSPAANTE